MLVFSLPSVLARRAEARLADYHRGICVAGGLLIAPPRGLEMAQVGTVKWFNPAKGWGFIILADGRDAMLHTTAIKAHDMTAVTVFKGSVIECDISEGERGLYVHSIKSITAPPATAEQGFVPGKVKWYNILKGFGFITFGEDTVDAFIHAEVVKAACMPDLLAGQDVKVVVSDTTTGRKVSDIRLA